MEAPVKRYLLFAGETYYPSGGWDDFIASFDTVAEARDAGIQHTERFGWFHIIDATTGTEMKSILIEGNAL
jgi:hypothetical protein